jgi:hypothetical protein
MKSIIDKILKENKLSLQMVEERSWIIYKGALWVGSR